MKLHGLDAIADPISQRMFRQIQSYLSNLEKNYGISPQDQNTGNSRVAPPATLPSFDTVQGSDGKLIIQLTPPSDPIPAGVVLYELQTSLTAPFPPSTSVTKYGPDVRLSWEILDPGVTKYVAVRSRYINSRYTSLVVHPTPIDTGLVSSSSLPPAVTGFTIVGDSPVLSQDGVNGSIVVRATAGHFGDATQVTYNAGRIDNLDFDTYYIYADDPSKAGGTVVYHATKTASDLSAYDGRVAFGVITLRSVGNAISDTTSSGTRCNGNGLLTGATVEKSDGTFVNVESLRRGDSVLGYDGLADTLVRDAERVDNIPGYGLATEQGRTSRGGAFLLFLNADGRTVQMKDLNAGDPVLVLDSQSGFKTTSDYVQSIVALGASTAWQIRTTRGSYLGGVLGNFVHKDRNSE